MHHAETSDLNYYKPGACHCNKQRQNNIQINKGNYAENKNLPSERQYLLSLCSSKKCRTAFQCFVSG